MKRTTKLMLTLLLCLLSVGSVSAATEKVYATFENPSNTNTSWDAETRTFKWTQTYYNQLRNIGLPNGDISKYKKLVVDCKMVTGTQFRILFYKGGSNKTLYAKDGVNEFIIKDELQKAAPDDYNEYILQCTEICLSGDNGSAPGEAIINEVYLETYPDGEGEEIPEIQYEEDPGKPVGDFLDFTAVLPNLEPRIGLGEDSHPIVLGNGDVVVGARTKNVIADLSGFSKLTMVTSPNLKVVLYMNHEIDAKQNAGDYTEEEAGKYLFQDLQADENGLIEFDLTKLDKQELNCICLPWDNSNKGTVWYLLLTEKEGKTVYLNPGIWDVADATERYAAYMFNDNGLYDWTDFKVSNNIKAPFEATIPARYTGIVLCRMNGETTENNWDNKWNQTDDIKPIINDAVFTITGWGEGDNAKSTYEVNAPEPVKNTYTATFENNGNWAEVYAYAWSGDGETAVKFLGDWPGTKIEATDGGYVLTFEAEAAPEKIIFSNGGDIKTEDLAFVNGQTYTYSKTEPQPIDPDLVEIPQDQGKTLDDFTRAELVEGEDYNTYTCTGDLQVAFKMYDIDVKDCDYVVVKFAEPVTAGWSIAFWAQGGTKSVEIPAGATEYKYVFADDSECAIANDVLPQITMLTLWGAEKPLVAKVAGVYKHKGISSYTAKFNNGGNWEKVYAYAWYEPADGSTGVAEILGNWPGTEIVKAEDDTYTLTFESALKPSFIIFNNGLDGEDKQQTENLAFENGKTYTYGKPEPQPVDPDLVEIPQDQGKTLDDFTRAELVEGEDYNTYTCTGDLQVAFKMYDIDVKDCDYVVVKFAEPVTAGWSIAFWAQGGTKSVEIPAGATEYKYVFTDDSECAIANDVLPQITMLTLWDAEKPLVAKVAGVYKHKVATVAEDVFTVAGTANLFGADWDTTASENELAKNEDGTYSITYEGVTIGEEEFKYEDGSPKYEVIVEYKVVKNHAWKEAWPSSNRQIIVRMPGTYDVTIHFNPATGDVWETMAVYKEITEAGYATYCTPYAINFEGSGVQAFFAKNDQNDGKLHFYEIFNAPLTTGLLLKAPAGTYKLKMESVEGDAAADVSGNKLIGVRGDSEYISSIYVLLNGEKGVGFYKTTKPFTVKAWTAFIGGEASSREFIALGDETTGIKTVATTKSNGEIFNLNGQRVVKAQKGLYIINGKKVMVK